MQWRVNKIISINHDRSELAVGEESGHCQVGAEMALEQPQVVVTLAEHPAAAPVAGEHQGRLGAPAGGEAL